MKDIDKEVQMMIDLSRWMGFTTRPCGLEYFPPKKEEKKAWGSNIKVKQPYVEIIFKKSKLFKKCKILIRKKI